MTRRWGTLRAGPYVSSQVFTHGIQLTRYNIGPVGTLTDVGSITTSFDGQVIENVRFTRLRILHNVTVRNFEGLAPTVTGQYTVDQTDIAKHAVFQNGRVLTRDPNTKGYVCYGPGTSTWERVVFRGGEDAVFVQPTGPQGPPGTYAHTFTEVWLGDLQSFEGSHADGFQVDGGAGGVRMTRCAFRGFEVPEGADPSVTQAVESTATRANAGFILTFDDNNIIPIDRILVENCYADGGNYSMNLNPPEDTPTDVTVTGNKFGRLGQFGALSLPSGSVASDNTYADNGDPV